ncbi:ATP-binding cassette domain-containing protein [Paraclostridium sordellii]|uniref:ATP-binding cassette domain-containing protein n=2 Tax=Paraclostridium sordellii TaxID=1505 RepID=UPI0028E4DD33
MSIVIISFSGFMIIKTTSTNLDYIITQMRKYSGSSANKYDYVISHYHNADTSIKKVDISKIKNINEVKDFDLLNYNEGNLIVEKNKVNESYINMFLSKYKNSNNQEISTSVIGVDDVNNIKEYVKEGNIKKLNELEKGYINIAVTNSFYDVIDGKYNPAIKDLKIGDILSLKIESKDINGNCYYENVKCRVVAMLDSSYLRIKEINDESGIRICMDFKNLQQITNNNYNQRISFNTSENSHSKINKLLEDINKDNDFLRIFNKPLALSKIPTISYYLVVMLLVLFSALFNIYITISLNLKNNVKEFSILRAIGISKKSLKKIYGKGESQVNAIDGISLEIENGKMTAIVGESGSGKSTLLHCIAGLDKPTSGNVYLGDEDIYKLNDDKLSKIRVREFGFVFQSFNLIPVINVYENIVLPISIDSKSIDKKYVDTIIDSLGLKNQIKKFLNELSGGQQQRVAIARALANKPSIIFADEPTGNLDSKTSKEVMDIFRMCVKEFNQTLVMITHDENIAQTADTIINIRDGKISSVNIK